MDLPHVVDLQSSHAEGIAGMSFPDDGTGNDRKVDCDDAGNDACSNNRDESGDDNRITQLESRLAFLENTIDVLAGELEAQQGETRMLHKKLVGLHQQLESQQRDTGIGDQPDEPPPHY